MMPDSNSDLGSVVVANPLATPLPTPPPENQASESQIPEKQEGKDHAQAILVPDKGTINASSSELHVQDDVDPNNVDPGWFVKWLMLLFGISSLLPWNIFINAAGLFRIRS